MGKLTIIEGNSNDKDNMKTFFVKAQKGDDGVSPTIQVEREGKVVTIDVEDAEGIKTTYVKDGVSPTVNTSKTGKVATVEIEDAEGTHTFKVNDGETYEVPTNAVVGWDSENAIPNGYEEVDNPNNYSLNETKIGTWIDGKPLYRKVFDAGYLPDDNSISINTGFGNTITVRKLYGTAYNPSFPPFTKPLPYVETMDEFGSINLNMTGYDGNILIHTRGDWSNLKAYVIVEYTKTTD